MFTFKSPANQENIWELCFRPKDKMKEIYFEDNPDDGARIFGITEYATQTVYIEDDLDRLQFK